jgi:hydroxymethylpyrimidine pyrophosphatase-like HAD family hydrolase
MESVPEVKPPALETSKPLAKPYEKPDIFFRGEKVLPRETNPITENASKYLDSVFERMKNGEKGDLMFDIDGVLTEISLETAANPKTLNAWAGEHKEDIVKFKNRIDALKKTGDFKVSICTGRGWDYTSKIVDVLFTKGSLDYAIIEGGAMVASPRENNEWNLRPAKSIDQESLKNLEKYKPTITKHVLESMGGALEPKQIRLTFNPPNGITGETYEGRIKEYLKTLGEENPHDKDAIGKISNNITHTPKTVEIMPSGIDKLLTLNEMIGKNMPVYFGDANTDLSAMKNKKEFKADVAPLNAEEPVKNYVKGDKEANGFFGLLPSQNDIKGVNEAIDLIYAHYKRLKRFPEGLKK